MSNILLSNNVINASLDDVFAHNVKQTVLKAYQTITEYKFDQMKMEENQEKKDGLETELYELIRTMQDLIRKDK